MLTGKDIDYAINFLGFPDAEQTINGKKVYTWGHSNTFTTMQTVRTPVSGNIYGTGGSAYYHGQTTSVVPQVHNYRCNTRLITDKSGIIERWEWNGNEGGCSHYSNAMKHLIQSNVAFTDEAYEQADAIKACGEILPPETVGKEFKACVAERLER